MQDGVALCNCRGPPRRSHSEAENEDGNTTQNVRLTQGTILRRQ